MLKHIPCFPLEVHALVLLLQQEKLTPNFVMAAQASDLFSFFNVLATFSKKRIRLASNKIGGTAFSKL